MVLTEFMKVTENLHVGLFWADIKKDERWRWYGIDIIRPFRVRAKALWRRCFPMKRHAFLAKCPSFGSYFTSAGGDRMQGCAIRYGGSCRLSTEAEMECKAITKMDPRDRRKRLGLE